MSSRLLGSNDERLVQHGRARSHSHSDSIRPNRLDDHRRDRGRRAGTAHLRVGRARVRRCAPTHHPGIGRRVRHRPRCHRLPAGCAACVRRRPHRRDRQHDPQAGRRGHALAVGRLLVLARAFQRRVRAGVSARGRRARRRRTRAGRGFADARDARVGWVARRRDLPDPDRADESLRRRGNHQGFPRHAQRRLRRGRTRTATSESGLSGPTAVQGDAPGQQALAPWAF